ncbi:RagB/SusD family nutrient uptake outer membrane protein [Chitinophaga sp. Hz27]|uniref:RagB/SusD family nutrient uptake outer membrane protein n=1 Tax=Chitinophaga sp. Hz27 TaxID=3347169 RepID=UPI0035DB7E7D
MIFTTIKKWTWVACLATSPILYTSCNKMLDIKPTDQVDEEDIFQSVSTVNRAVLGVYAGWAPEYTLRIGSVMADECVIGPKNAGVNGDAQLLYRWSYTGFDPAIAAPWTNGYQVINRANRILAGLSKVPVQNDADNSAKQQLEGELLAIRAFQHFELYRIYANSYLPEGLAVPYITITDNNNKPARPSTAEFMAKLQEDLDKAMTEISEGTDNTRMNKQTVYALKARIALYTSHWSDALLFADKAIANATLATRAEFPAIWTDKSNAEVIFKLKRTNQSSMRPGDIWKNAGLGIIYFAPSPQLLQAYDTQNDVRAAAYFDHDPTLEEEGQLADIITKYKGEDGATNRNDVKVFRIAEMYLIRAEAYAQLGNLAASIDQLNTLREARIQDYKRITFPDIRTINDAIATERWKELPFEGHRFFDLKRRRQPVVRETQAGQEILSPEDIYYNIPIPQSEILSNPNIKPNNSGW